MKIDFGRIVLTKESKDLVNSCLDSNWITQGPQTKLLEEEWAKLFNYKYSSFLSSGTTAITAACLALYEFGATEGDNILCPALSFIASGTGIKMAGLIPKFIDVRMDMQIDDSKIEENIDKRTKAILVVPLMGKPPKLDKIQEIAKKHKLYIIIDNAEGYFSTYKKCYALSYGDIETTSLFSAHMLQSGEGSLVSTNNIKWDELIKRIRSHGRPLNSNYFDHSIMGGNFKNTDIAAAIARGQLNTIMSNVEKRKKIWYHITNILASTASNYLNILNEDSRIEWIAPHGITFIFKQPELTERFKGYLDGCQIEWKSNFHKPIPNHGAFRSHPQHKDTFPVSEYISKGIHIGCSAFWTDNEVEYLYDCIRKYFTKII